MRASFPSIKRSSGTGRSSATRLAGTEFSRTSWKPQAPNARVGSRLTPDALSSTTASADLSTATRRCVQLSATSTKRSSPVARPFSSRTEPALRSGSSTPKENATRAAPTCNFSSRLTAASERTPDNARLARAADHMGAGHAARPSSAITTKISRSPPSVKSQPREATPCPTSLVQIAETSSGGVACSPSARHCAARNPRRESRSICLTSSFGSWIKSMPTALDTDIPGLTSEVLVAAARTIHGRDAPKTLRSNRSPDDLRLAELRLAFFLERGGRLLVISGIERHLLQRHGGFEHHVDPLLDDLVDRQFRPANSPGRAVGEFDRNLAGLCQHL